MKQGYNARLVLRKKIS